MGWGDRVDVDVQREMERLKEEYAIQQRPTAKLMLPKYHVTMLPSVATGGNKATACVSMGGGERGEGK